MIGMSFFSRLCLFALMAMFSIQAQAQDQPHRLDQELQFAKAALKQPGLLAGAWSYRFPYFRGEDPEEGKTQTINLVYHEGVLYSQLQNWGGQNYTTGLTKVSVNEAEMVLEIEYPGSLIKIKLRPISRSKARYGFASRDDLDNPTEYSKVFTRK